MTPATVPLQIGTAPLPITGIRFHLSLNVKDLTKSIAFFELLFDVKPAKCRSDYAKFELADPPLVLSLEPYDAPAGGNLNHLGFRLASSEQLVEIQRRLELGGISTRREEGVECCYARQTKFWVHDPDGNMWEMYTLDEDLEHRGDGQLPMAKTQAASEGCTEAASIWQHRLGQPFPAKLPLLDESVDLIKLQGTFNAKLSSEERLVRLAELLRVLRPSGKLELHMLTADQEVPELSSRLPGPASIVEAVPHDDALLALLTKVGFSGVHYALRAEHCCFRVDKASLRETRISASK